MKRSYLLITTALLLSGCNDHQAVNWYDAFKAWLSDKPAPQKFVLDDLSQMQAPADDDYIERTPTGSYLAGRFAQSNFDWETASKYFTDVLSSDPKNLELERRAMVLSMGAGQYKDALDHARAVIKSGETASLPQLFLTLETFKSGDYAQVLLDVDKIPEDGISQFIKPLLKSWASAGEKKVEIASLNKNVVHYYHAILIADYLDNTQALKALSTRDYSRLGLSVKSLAEIADIFKRHGLTAEANELVRNIPEEALNAVDKNDKKIETPLDGMSRALFDMASVLYQDYPDSARLFAEMSLYLNPSMDDSRILMAHMAAQFKRYDEAIAIFNQIDDSKDPELSIKLDRQIAELLVESGKTDQGIKVLKDIVDKTKSVDAQIQIGDIYRAQEDFNRALDEYNKAFKMLDNKITAKYWNLLYARGIANERLKNWAEAEKDLKSALALEPDQPYILNYLAYSWTDQGINLDEATRMIEKAVRLRPDDGYIVDSLGWVYYKQGKFTQAAEALDRAVELSPYDPTINDHLGDAYWQVGRKSEARFQWQRAMSFKPDADLENQLQLKIENGLTQSSAAQAAGSAAQASSKLPSGE